MIIGRIDDNSAEKNTELDHLDQLNAKLSNILRKKDENMLLIEELNQQIALLKNELDLYSLAVKGTPNDRINDKSFDATTPTEVIRSMANPTSGSKRITYLNRFISKKSSPAPSSSQFDTKALEESGDGTTDKTATPIITMKLVAFLNAKHYMVFGDKRGSTHGHSWQFQIEAEVSVEDSSFIRFEDLERHIGKILEPYQRNVLNEISPYNLIEPLTENIAALFFNRLDDDFKQFNVRLIRLTAWENPTKGIEISHRLNHFFSTGENTNKPTPIQIESLNQASATLEVAEESSNEDSGMPNQDAANDEEEQEACTPGSSSNNSSDSGIEHIDETVMTDSDSVVNEKEKEDPIENKQEIVESDSDSTSGDNDQRNYKWWHYVLAISLIIGVAVWAYWPILTAPLDKIYPYGSDAWCHLFKADFLSKEILKGNYYPQYYTYWHNGVQPFRYWAPLTYYIIALINLLTKNVFVALNYYLFGCAILGGICWLIFSKRIGIWQAALGGIIWVVWLDNIKESFLSGNYPRVLTIALLPLLLELFIKTMKEEKKVIYFLFVALLICAIVLCHPMIAAIYGVSLLSFAILLWFWGDISLKGLIRGGLALFSGLLISSWWLLPALTGGGAGFSDESTLSPTRFIAASISFNPHIRGSINYWGISLLALILIFVLSWRYRSTWAKSLFISGIFYIILTFPEFKFLQNLLPLNNLLWPKRFSSFWSLALLLSAFSLNAQYQFSFFKRKLSTKAVLAIVVFFFLAADSFFSLRVLAHTTPFPNTILQCIESIKQYPGWKVATLDLSRLGSTPSYLLPTIANREQVYGWAWQGATTAGNVMLINTAMENNWYPYIFQRLDRMGSTDLMVKENTIIGLSTFGEYASLAGYEKVFSDQKTSHWHGLDGPYITVNRKKGIAIGKYASNYALQFPSLEIGSSLKIDDYNIEELKQYKTVVLTGASWSSQAKAEKMIIQYAQAGGRVLVDLTGFPVNVMARQPAFLGVFGETITINKPLTISSKDTEMKLEPFALENWVCVTPQPIDQILISYKHYGNDAALLGSKIISDTPPIYFLGANIAYHSFLTHDKTAMNILQETLGLSSDYEQAEIIPLQEYHVNKDGYSMSYETSNSIEAILPVAALEGMKARVDEQLISTRTYENLIMVNLPAGKHTITLELVDAPIFIWSKYLSLFSILFITSYIVFIKRRKKGGSLSDEKP
ncbi:MAG: hypothetical protein CVU90_11995 [Firmicutes bacterium HGW-Firmicutes-15]|nr:MAG: hypothetical protein CVU90_11995 [Firmicutes bacterium HGW-Firmicutes-15]